MGLNMYYIEPLTKSTSYLLYVDNLRKEFAIRIEVKNDIGDYLVESHLKLRAEIMSFLESRLSRNDWEMQKPTGYHGLHYIWFNNKEDALAVILQFGGKVI
jgi:hypothetical protein